MQAASDTAAPRVLAVLVAHDGAAWLPRTLAALDQQSYPYIDVVAVDNASSDGGRELLVDHLGTTRVLVADRDLGFPAAVSMALDARPASEAEFVLLLHDDCALAPDAVAQLVAALVADPRLAVVGPKLCGWDDPEILESVGWTIDTTGRADNGLDPDELDQGQRDQERRVLYVSTAGMVVRRDALEQLGRFDRRFHLFRDDLDLCWRAWLAGHDVEVVPDAVAHHVGGAANYLRLGQTRFIGPRYFAERNTLATLLKNYGLPRLLLVVPLYFLVGIAKVAGFLLTRRVSDAWQTVRAWLWNGYYLRQTWRHRREVQAVRTRTDGELKQLFGRIFPRVRAYAEAIAEWIAGGDEPTDAANAPREKVPAEPETATRRLLRLVRNRPVLAMGLVLVTVVAAGAWPLLVPGELRGGELAPWPESPEAFLVPYVAGWNDAGAFGTSAPSSPAQALLGLFHLVVGGSTYLAPRLLLLGAFAAAWLLGLKAAQPYARRKLPRVVAATAYVLSPPALAALTTGRVGALVVFAAAPGILAAGTTLARQGSSPHRAWRAVAAAALLGAVAGAFEPIVVPALLVGGAAVLLVGLLRDVSAAWRGTFATRVIVAAVGPTVLLLPWSATLPAANGPLFGVDGVVVGGELWRWLALSPDLAGFPGLAAGVGFVLAGLLGLALGGPRRPGMVAGLWVTALGGAVAAWLLGRAGGPAWPGLGLLVTAGAFAGLLAMAFATAEAQLARHAFGWRQLASLATAAGVAVSLVTVVLSLEREPWDVYAVGEPSLPSFVVAAAAEQPFRVVVLADRAGVVDWDVVDGAGPSMAAFGVQPPAEPEELVGDAVTDLLTGRDPGAAARLGVLNVRYLYVPAGGTSDALDLALRGQTGIEPRPVVDGRVFALLDWLPRASIVPDAVARHIETRREVPEGATFEALERTGPGRYLGRAPEPGTVLVAEVADPGWTTSTAAGPLEAAETGTVRFDEVEAGSTVTVSHAGDVARTAAVAGQLLAVLLAVSLALRPPRFARDRDDRAVRNKRPWSVGAEDREPEVVG